MRSLFGMYELLLEADGRLALPEKIAIALGGGPVGWLTPEGALRVASLDSIPMAELRRAMVSTEPISVDDAGMMDVPEALRVGAELEPGETCILIGMGDSIEVWNRARYASMSANWQY